MPRTFVLIDVDLFNDDNYFVPQQMDMLNDNENHQEIRIKLSEPTTDIGYSIYECHYDKKVRKTIKIRVDLFYDTYYVPSDFFLYYNQTKKIAFIGASTELAVAFCDKLNKTDFFRLEALKLDLNDIIGQADAVNGVWISKIKEMHLKSAGYFGNNVHHSHRARETLNDSSTEISSFGATYYSDTFKEDFQVLFSKKGSITIMDTLPNELDYIKLVNEIFDKLLKTQKK